MCIFAEATQWPEVGRKNFFEVTELRQGVMNPLGWTIGLVKVPMVAQFPHIKGTCRIV